ncbi:hypothetical protein Vretimale_14915 [Volvox reticuliferus]|nr:hypothetical protein Vretimale_14915 [Volvox reticuliferus]
MVDGNAQLFFAADMGYVDPPSWRRMRAACGDMFWNATRDTECWDAQSVVKDDLWDLNWYDVLDPCAKADDDDAAAMSSNVAMSGNSNGGGSRQRRQASELERLFFWPFTARMGYPPSQPTSGSASAVEDQPDVEAGRRGSRRLWGPWLRHVVPCMDRRIALDWLNRAEVRAALRAAPFSVVGLRALVYSGDHDMVVPHTGTRKWLYDKAKLGSTDGPLRPWMLHGQIAGFHGSFRCGCGSPLRHRQGGWPHGPPEQAPPGAAPADDLHIR